MCEGPTPRPGALEPARAGSFRIPGYELRMTEPADMPRESPAATMPPDRGRRGCFTVVLGVLTVLVGIPMLVCPGPGMAVIGAGVGMVAVGLGIRTKEKS